MKASKQCLLAAVFIASVVVSACHSQAASPDPQSVLVSRMAAAGCGPVQAQPIRGMNVVVALAGKQYEAKEHDYVIACRGANVIAEGKDIHVDAYQGAYVSAAYGTNVHAFAGSRIDAYDSSKVLAEAGSTVVTMTMDGIQAKPGAKVIIDPE